MDDVENYDITMDDKIVDPTEDSSISSDSPDFTAEEIDAFRATKNLLLTKHNMSEDKISIRTLIIVTMNCKLRPDTSADKYKRWLDLIDTGMGVTSFDSAWEEIGQSGENLVGHQLASFLIRTYAGEWKNHLNCFFNRMPRFGH